MITSQPTDVGSKKLPGHSLGGSPLSWCGDCADLGAMPKTRRADVGLQVATRLRPAAVTGGEGGPQPQLAEV